MKKRLTAALVLCLAAGCALLALGWRSAETQARNWEDRTLAAEHRMEALEQALATAENRRELLENDPIAAFFAPFPYSGGTARYLAYLEAGAYQAEMEHAALLLKNRAESDASTDEFIDEFTAFIHRQAQAEANAWEASLTAQGAVTAGAWAHVDQCQIPIYQFGARALISACQRGGTPYSYLFSAGEVREQLLAGGFSERDLPPYKGRLFKKGMLICTN